jgi:thiamine monophosphate kinase
MSNLCLSIDPDKVIPREGASIEERLTDGEDYELLFAVSPEKAELLKNEWSFEDLYLREAGIFSNGDKGVVKDMSGRTLYDNGSDSYIVFDHLV